jgi:PAS domain S-box-containing protein
VVVPPLASWLTAHETSLHLVPFALLFISMAGIAALGGLYPALLAFAVTLFTRNYFTHLGSPTFESPTFDMERLGVLFVTLLVVSLIGRRRLQSEEKLETTLAALQERTDDLVASLASSKCACWIIDLDSGRSTRWYRGSYPIFGRPFPEIEALPSLISLLHPDDQPRLLQLRQQMRASTEPIVFEHRVCWPNGELHWLEMRGNRIPGKPCVWRGVTVDVTERKLAEAALIRVEKLAAMGRLASTVAHEINNPLEAVTNLLYLSRSDEALSEPTRSYLASAERELARLGNITRLTLGFVRSSGSVSSVDIASIVDDVLSIFQHRLETRSIEIERHFTPGVTAWIAPHELRQIATNLIANAADAVPLAGARIVLHIGLDAGFAVLLVEDNGSGIPEANRHRVFEPFFSTKDEVGTGIGLWVTRELVEKHGGRITLETEGLPKGVVTRFRVQLPPAPESPPELELASASALASTI